MSIRISPHSAVGKDFPTCAPNGKKLRRLAALFAGAAMSFASVGGLGMVEAQEEAPRSDIRVRLAFADEAVVGDGLIRLGDLAQVVTNDLTLKTKLEAVVIGTAPHVGQAMRFRADSARLALRRERRTLGLSDTEIVLDGSATVLIRSESQSIGPDALLELLRADVAAKAEELYGAERVELRWATKPAPIAIPPGEWSVEPLWTRFPKRIASTVTVPLRIVVNGEPWVHSPTVALNLQAYASIPVAGRPLHRHETLRPDDVKFMEMDLTRLNGQTPMKAFAEAVGVRATKDIPAGEPLTDRNSETLPLVEQGDQIVVILEAPRLKLTMIGQALESGRYGETIRIKNLVSGKVIRGAVTRPREAKVTLPELRAGAPQTAQAR